jgi:hypothetical protein
MAKLENLVPLIEKWEGGYNSYPNQEKLHLQIKTARIYFVDKLCEIQAKNNKFKQEWKNRISDFNYAPLLLLCFLLGLLSSGCRSASVATQEIVAESLETSENRGENIQILKLHRRRQRV